MGRAATYLTELGVGVACVLVAWAARDRAWLAAVLAAAGLLAAGHSAWRLLT